jgi:predicted DNA-binding protein
MPSRLGRPTTLYIDQEMYRKLRKLTGRPASQEVNDLIRKRVAELEGQPQQVLDKSQYEDLKYRLNKLVKDADTLRATLRKHGNYDRLNILASELGLTKDFHNLNEVAPQLLSEANDADMHQFISLIETIREAREIKTKLSEIRTDKTKMAGLIDAPKIDAPASISSS